MTGRFISWLLDPSGLTPHGFCLLWQPGLIWTFALADFATGAAYFAIPIALAVILRRRKDLVFQPILWLFIAFILLCGITHWLDVITLWVPIYAIQGAAKTIAATVSVLTAIVLYRVLPEALARPSLAQFEEVAENLRQGKDFLDRIGTAAGVGGWELDLATLRLSWSSETYRIHGLPLDFQPTLETGITFYAPEARPIIRAAVEKCIADGLPWDLELPFNRADGEQIWVRAMGSATLVDGQPVRLTGAFQDVTSRVAARRALQDINERVELATDCGRIGIWDWDLVHDVLFWDAWMYRLYGMEAGDGRSTYELWTSHLHPDDRAGAEQAVQDDIEGVKPYRYEFRIVWSDGSVHHIGAAGHVTRNSSGRATRMIGTNWDVTEARDLTVQLAAQHELLSVTLDSIGDGVITTDPWGSVTWLNPMAEKMTGWTDTEARGRPLTQVFQIIHEETRTPAENPMRDCMDRDRIVALQNNILLIARDGTERGVEDTASPMRNEKGEVLGMVLVFHDVTEQRRLAGEMSHRTSHDFLTGLINRPEFEIRLHRALERVHTDDHAHALLYIDLDQFKIVNDSCGHAIGDQLLVQVAKLLSDVVRTSDTVARIGGDEFAVLLEDCPLVHAQRLAQRICDRLDSYRFVHEDKRFRVGASIGLVPVDGRLATTAAVQQAADSSCYAAKEAGRNRVQTWSESDTAIHARRGEVQWATRLEAALDGDRFTLFFQHIQPLSGDDQGLYAEVLLRLRDDGGGYVLPGAFMPAAERFNLASRIDRWVLRETIHCMQSKVFRDAFEKLSINLSGQSVGDRAFHRWAVDVLDEAGPEICSKLCLEITETVAVTNLADASIFIEQLRKLKVSVALDDFGAGASSFGYLNVMPVDVLKIDGQFVRDLLVNPLHAAAVRCFIDVAGVVGLKTVAEFVDDPDILRRLRQMGVDFAQGYLVHRPEPLSALMETIQTAATRRKLDEDVGVKVVDLTGRER
ncbi:EAL domain-containing protein [Lichenicola sp.]|uniref:PAS domain-containing protein n=1 Tax=Lichenicola sp. TaxID=2804529 RepID=UPI003AFFA7C3